MDVQFSKEYNMRNDIAIYCVTTENIKDYSDITSKSKIEYCNKQNYQYFEYGCLDNSRHPSWSHLLAAKDIFENHPDINIAFRVDGDAMIMNHNIRIEDVLAKYTPDINKYHIIGAGDINCSINAGVFFFIRQPDIIEVIDELYAMTEFINHSWWENAAIIKYHSIHPDRFLIIPQREINSYSDMNRVDKDNAEFHPGDFIVHTPGCQNRPSYFNNKYNEIIR
jgi:hypothetical protein